MLTHDEQQKIINALLKRKQNSLCADCSSKSPCWASLNFGVFVCLNCSGAHRALGPSITRVKSARLDSWQREWVDCMQVGNSVLNQYWESRLGEGDRTTKPNSNSSLDAIIRYVQDKYVRKLFVDPHDPIDPLKRTKSGNHNQAQLSPNHELKAKVVKTTGKQQKTNMVIGETPGGKGNPDFSVFDVMAKERPKPKAPQNLISFQQEKGRGMKKGLTFDDFEFGVTASKPTQQKKPTQEKYNKQQFMSMGGINPTKIKTQVSFEGFSKIQTNSHPQNHSNLIHFDHNPTHTQPNHPVQPAQLHFHEYNLPNHSTQTQHQQHQQHQQHLYQQHYNKNQYATMGGGMHPAFRNEALLAGNHNKNIGGMQMHQHQHQTKKNGHFNEVKNTGFGQGMVGQLNEKAGGKHNAITLEANINFDQNKQKKGQTATRSWVDDWM